MKEQVIGIDILTLKSTIKDTLMEVLGEKTSHDQFQNDRLNRHEAATFIGVSVSTMDKFIKSGQLTQYSMGHRKFLLKSEIIAWLTQKEK